MVYIKEVTQNIYLIDNRLYSIPKWGSVYLIDEEKKPGTYEIEFHSAAGNRQLATGNYYSRLKDDPSSRVRRVFVQTKKMILIK